MTDAAAGVAPCITELTPARMAEAVARMDGSKVYDLSVDYFIGMPSFQAAGDPPFQIYMTHTPEGTIVDNLNGMGAVVNSNVAYSGDVILMYTHTGTHIDSFNHFGYGSCAGKDLHPHKYLGSRNWTKGGADEIPPIIARGLLLDVAETKGVECLPPSYAITAEDLQASAKKAGVEVQAGDVVLIRTGRMRYWPDGSKVLGDSPGLSLESARWLTSKRVAVIGADNEAVEVTPSPDPENWLPVHCHLLAEAGVPQMEILNLEELSAAKLYEFVFIAAPIKLRGATGSPLRPLVFPMRKRPG